jgi:hypothetical protein
MAFFVTLTIFSKQNGISLLLLVPFWLILKKNFKHALLFFLFTSILSCCAFYYFQYIFTNQVFSDHIFHALKNKIDPHWFYVYIFKLIAESPLILPLIIALGVSMKAIANNLESFIVRLGILFIIQFFFSSALAFKWGSSLGYFNESFLIGFLLISAYVTKYTTEEDHKFIRTINTYIYPAFLIFVLHVTLQFYFYFLNDRYKNKIRFDEQVKVSNYIKKEIGNKDNYIINLYSPNSDFFKALLFRVNAAPNFDAVNCCTLPGNLFDYRQLLEGLRNGKILYLIEKEDNKEKALWGVSLDNYKIDTTLFGYTLYKFAGKTQKYN